MLYLQKMLLPDEKIVCLAHLHWIIFVPGIFFTCVGGFLGFFSYDIVYIFFGEDAMAVFGRVLAGFGFVLALVGLVLSMAAFVRQASTELAITNGRIIAKYGFIARKTYEIMLNRITGVNFDQSILGRMLGYGTILVQGAGGDTSPFYGVAKPYVFQRALMRVLGRGGSKESVKMMR